MSLTKTILLWVLAFVIMAAMAVFTRLTGPTKPVRGKVELQEQEIKYKLPRSTDTDGKKLIKIDVKNENIEGRIRYRRYKSHDEWHEEPMLKTDNALYADIPEQPAAGKVMYQIILSDTETSVKLTEEPIIIRFKGVVPDYVLLPHILFMFLAMVFSTRTGLEVLFKGKNVYILSILTAIALFLGGMILGPMVQKYAFDAYWTGWPFGHDLTDNKTLVAMIMWIVAVIMIRRNPAKKGWALAAAIVLMLVYLVPHSVLGSEIDYTQLPNK